MAKITVIPNNPEMKELVDLKPNVVFAKPDGEELAMQILKPMWKSEDGKGFPLVVFIQGSAWTKPNMFWELPQLSLLTRRGFVIASVTHRSAFTAKAPAFLQDVKTAIRFLRANAEEYDIDKTRVCAWGTSSGGNTALLVGMTGDDPELKLADYSEESDAVNAVVDCFGPTDLNKMMEVQYRMTATDGQQNLFAALAGGSTVEECREPLKKISPIQYVQPGKDFPPFLMLHGDADPVVLYEDSEALYNRLAECGYEVDLVRVTDAPHEGNFWSMQLLEIIFDFIQKQIG
ncbi:MAG: alpha/beta hydrolase [Clostridia bacterium]|nr:alpha/beta hydrolase [Clostridia bacterium]